MHLNHRLCAFAVVAVGVLARGAGAYAAEHEQHWSYSGATGPADWGKLEPQYRACSVGKTQSPIDIREDRVAASGLSPIEFDYRPSPLKLIDNGHTIQVNVDRGSSITVNGRHYELVQFHFHKPSEEALNGAHFAMVAHLVHKDEQGKLAVVAVLLTKGDSNALLRTLWDHLPQTKNQEVAVPDVRIDASELLPRDRSYYTFEGSLTTPPCSEGVRWFVLRHPLSVSAGQIARFAQLYPMNARPLQPLNGREIGAGG